jgi:hypothetical protein
MIDECMVGHLDLDESTTHRSEDWLRALGAQDELKEEALLAASGNSEKHGRRRASNEGAKCAAVCTTADSNSQKCRGVPTFRLIFVVLVHTLEKTFRSEPRKFCRGDCFLGGYGHMLDVPRTRGMARGLLSGRGDPRPSPRFTRVSSKASLSNGLNGF